MCLEQMQLYALYGAGFLSPFVLAAFYKFVMWMIASALRSFANWLHRIANRVQRPNKPQQPNQQPNQPRNDQQQPKQQPQHNHGKHQNGQHQNQHRPQQQPQQQTQHQQPMQ